MEKKKSAMKKFFGEFKKFITRGNVPVSYTHLTLPTKLEV